MIRFTPDFPPTASCLLRLKATLTRSKIKVAGFLVRRRIEKAAEKPAGQFFGPFSDGLSVKIGILAALWQLHCAEDVHL
jgi:hypothetical protein